MVPGRHLFGWPKQGDHYMNKTESRGLVAGLTIALIVAVQFAVVTSADAKSAKCSAQPVPGKPGTFIVTCSTKRP